MRYVLVPGSDGRAWYWHRVRPLLEARGHEVVAVDLPVGDPRAGLEEHAEVVVDAIGREGSDAVLVAQSLGGFIAPVAAARRAVARLILVNAMVPKPGESAGEWWEATGQGRARHEHYEREGLEMPADFDVLEAFFHDVPAAVVDEAMAAGENPARFDTLFGQPWSLPAWPDVPTRFIQGRDDRFFPAEFQRRVVRERLGIDIELIPGGHLVALSHPEKLTRSLV